MKIRIYILYISSFLLLTGIGTFSSCDNEDKGCYCESNVISTVDNLMGTIHYNSINNRWFIMKVEPHTYDSVTNYYPQKLDKDYQIEGLRVKFSGDLYIFNEDDPDIVPAGYEEYCIDLLNIEKQL